MKQNPASAPRLAKLERALHHVRQLEVALLLLGKRPSYYRATAIRRTLVRDAKRSRVGGATSRG